MKGCSTPSRLLENRPAPRSVIITRQAKNKRIFRIFMSEYRQDRLAGESGFGFQGFSQVEDLFGIQDEVILCKELS
jgi:hypothetical protein